MVAMGGLGALAVLKLGSEFYRLVWSTASNGAIDLAMRHEETRLWFAGEPVYAGLERITYPPAAYLYFWPVLGWTTLAVARVVWALTTVAMLAWLGYLLIRGSGAALPRDRLFIGLIVLSMNAVGVAVGNGQLVLHLLPPMLAALLLLRNPNVTLTRDLAASALLTVALIKPTLSLPFFWIPALTVRRIRPLVLTAGLYGVASLVSAGFQSAPLPGLIGDWFRQAERYLEGGYGDVQSLLLSLDLAPWVNLPSIILFAGLGLWIWRYRDSDFWLVLGVAALIARLWTYHRNYDDALILLPIVALFRLGKGFADQRPRAMAMMLCCAGVVAMLAPARLEFAGPPLSLLYVGGHALIWVLMLGYLGFAARPSLRPQDRDKDVPMFPVDLTRPERSQA